MKYPFNINDLSLRITGSVGSLKELMRSNTVTIIQITRKNVEHIYYRSIINIENIPKKIPFKYFSTLVETIKRMQKTLL